MGSETNSVDTTRLDSSDNGVTVNIRHSNGSKFSVKTSLDSTVGDFKALIARNCDVPADQQRLIYKGRILKDDQTLNSYGLQADHTVHMVRGFPTAAATPPPATAGAASDNPSPGVTQGVGSYDSVGLGGLGLGSSLFSGLSLNTPTGGNRGSLGSGLPGLEQVHQQLNQNPNLMRDIMNTPLMQNMLNNPELIRGLMMSNPQMRELIDRNPELAHILNDPSTLRQTLEVARNPELMREMMRNTDRAMSNIEAMPEGFNMLRRMYENVQEPFLSATTMGGNNGNELGSNPFAALLGSQVGSQVTDGTNNPSSNSSEPTTGVTSPNTNPLPNPWGNSGGGPQLNTANRSSPTGDIRTPGLGGLGALGLSGMDQMFGGMPDATSLSQVMQNPVMSQMMQSLLSNPQTMNQILNFNPQLRSMVDSNPQMREMLQNPELLRQLTSPEMMQQMLALQQSLLAPLNRQQSNGSQGQTDGATGAPNLAGLDLLTAMLGGLGAGSLTGTPPSNVPPEELYATQLAQLQEMGFFDTQENIRALRATAGNVNAAVERLLGNPGQ